LRYYYLFFQGDLVKTAAQEVSYTKNHRIKYHSLHITNSMEKDELRKTIAIVL